MIMSYVCNAYVARNHSCLSWCGICRERGGAATANARRNDLSLAALRKSSHARRFGGLGDSDDNVLPLPSTMQRRYADDSQGTGEDGQEPLPLPSMLPMRVLEGE